MHQLITLTSDFGIQSQGVGIMEATIFSIAPSAKIIHLMHGLPSYDIIAGARTMETIQYVPIGTHLCICDPTVGSKRKALALKVGRGDFLVGPDNGVLLPATRILGGIIEVHEILNPKYMSKSISPIFHGRDIFAPAAAHLTNGVLINDLGPKLNPQDLVSAPYEDAIIYLGKIECTVIQINKFGSVHLNILQASWDEWGLKASDVISLALPKTKDRIDLLVCEKFSDVSVGSSLILKDDYGRIEIAINQGAFASKNNLHIGDKIILTPKKKEP